MNCEQLDELLAAYALSALDPDEAERARLHLTECRRHDEALAGLQAVAQRLPLIADEREPSPELRARLLVAFDVEAGNDAPAVITPRSASARPVLMARPRFAYLAAAILVLAVVGLLAWNLTLQLGGSSHPTLSATLAGAAGKGELVYSRADQVGVLNLDLPALPPGRAYQVWKIEATGAVSLGLVSDNGVAGFRADLSQATAVAVTEEPAGGSEQPTAAPLLVAQLR
jgi:anti-sigma-K factor RskA